MFTDINEPIKTKSSPIAKRIIKKGTLDIGVVETTPVVWKGRLLRYEWIRPESFGEPGFKCPSSLEKGYFRFTDMESGERTPPFAFGHSFGSAYIENGTAYVFGLRGDGAGHAIDMYISSDLVHWEERNVIELPDTWQIFNNSVCRSSDGYILTFEAGAPAELVGKAFTNFYLKSVDLESWEMLDPEIYVFTKERYSACPSIRWFDGYYYIIYLEGLPAHRWLPYIVRSRDLITYELGIRNPIMFFSDEDKKAAPGAYFTPEQIELIQNAVNLNNSDIDFCEYNGKTVILYSWGNQYGKEFLAWAEYNGGVEEFLKSFF